MEQLTDLVFKTGFRELKMHDCHEDDHDEGIQDIFLDGVADIRTDIDLAQEHRRHEEQELDLILEKTKSCHSISGQKLEAFKLQWTKDSQTGFSQCTNDSSSSSLTVYNVDKFHNEDPLENDDHFEKNGWKPKIGKTKLEPVLPDIDQKSLCLRTTKALHVDYIDIENENEKSSDQAKSRKVWVEDGEDIEDPAKSRHTSENLKSSLEELEINHYDYVKERMKGPEHLREVVNSQRAVHICFQRYSFGEGIRYEHHAVILTNENNDKNNNIMKSETEFTLIQSLGCFGNILRCKPIAEIKFTPVTMEDFKDYDYSNGVYICRYPYLNIDFDKIHLRVKDLQNFKNYYSFSSMNCENVATKIYTGKGFSKQLDCMSQIYWFIVDCLDTLAYAREFGFMVIMTFALFFLHILRDAGLGILLVVLVAMSSISELIFRKGNGCLEIFSQGKSCKPFLPVTFIKHQVFRLAFSCFNTLLTSVKKWVVQEATGCFNTLLTSVKKWVVQEATGCFNTLLTSVKKWVVQEASGCFDTLLTSVKKWVVQLVNCCFNTLPISVKNWIVQLVTCCFNTLPTSVKKWVVQVATGCFNTLTTSVKKWVDQVATSCFNVLTTIVKKWVVQLVTGCFKTLSTSVKKWVVQVVTDRFNTLLTSVKNWIVQLVTGCFNTLPTSVKKWVVQVATGCFNTLMTSVKKWVVQLVTGCFRTLSTFVKKCVIKLVTNCFNTLLISVQKWVVQLVTGCLDRAVFMKLVDFLFSFLCIASGLRQVTLCNGDHLLSISLFLECRVLVHHAEKEYELTSGHWKEKYHSLRLMWKYGGSFLLRVLVLQCFKISVLSNIWFMITLPIILGSLHDIVVHFLQSCYGLFPQRSYMYDVTQCAGQSRC